MNVQSWWRRGQPASRGPESGQGGASPALAGGEDRTAASTDNGGASLDGPPLTGFRRAAARLVALEPWLAPICALILLLAPNPLIWPAALVGLLPSAARLATTGRPWRASAFDGPLLLLAIGALLGGWASLSRDGALIRLTGMLGAFFLFAAAREHLRGAGTLRWLVPGLLASAVVSSLALMVLVGPFLLLDHVPPVAWIVNAVDRWQLGAWFVDQDWLLQRYRFRASGVGALGVMGLALAFAMFVGQGGWRARTITLLTVPVFLIMLVVADNRGSMLAGAMTVGAMATVWRLRLLPLVPLASLLTVLFLAFGPNDRGLSLKTLAQRFWFWENSVYLAREVPLTGAGLGLESVQLVYRAYFLPAYPPFSHAHNIYLQGLLEYGVFGLLGLLWFGLATLWVGWRAPAAGDRWTMAGRLAGFGLSATMLTTGLSEIVMLTTFGNALAFGAFGLLAATSDRPPATAAASIPRRRAARLPRWQRVGAAAAAALALAAILAVTPLGPALAARVLLNAGTADLNRATLSESIDKRARDQALDRATETLRLVTTLNPDDLAGQRNLALALAANDDSRRGRAAADRARALTPANSRADQFQLGRMYTSLNAWGDAIRAYQAAEAAPQLIQLGNRLLRLRNFDQATNAFIATARVDPTSRGAYEGVTRAVRDRKGSADDAVAALGPLLERDSKTEYSAHLQAAQIYREAGRLHEAADQLVRAEELYGGPELAFELGRLMLTGGLPERAEPLLRRPVKEQPYEPDNWLWLARALAALGRDEEAIDAIRQGLSKVDTSGQFAPPAEKLPETAAVRAAEIKRSERAPMLGVMAESMLRLGRAADALPALDEAVAAVPKDAWLTGLRAQAQAAEQGGQVNLALNPSFDRDGSWTLRTGEWWLRPGPRNLVNELPAIADGVAAIAQPETGTRTLVQEVLGLEPGRRYRLTVRLRGQGLTSDSVRVSMVNHRTTREVVRIVEQPQTPGAWQTVSLDSAVSEDNLTVMIGFGPHAPAGAQIFVDEVTLTPADGPRSATAPSRPGG
ncbi:MAG: O-antigen ligase family protein [Chloroflexi bacterium]|nr:O-antigen ligase family protein [Chloroflexota bacterium]